MKVYRQLLVLVVFLASGIVSSAAQKDTLRILAIGNSFSVNAVEQNLHSIAEAQGKCAIIGNLYIGGCSLERHWNNAKDDAPAYSYRKINCYGVRTVEPGMSISRALKDEKWDVVTFQQASHFSGLLDTYEPFLSDLYAYVKAGVSPETVFYWHQTWAYAADSGHKAFPNYDRDQNKMYSMIMAASSKACKDHDFGIIPCGTAIQNGRGTAIGDKFNVPDGFHLNELGCYVAACTWFRVLFAESVSGNSFRPQYVSEENCVIAQKCADAAARKPFSVKKIK